MDNVEMIVVAIVACFWCYNFLIEEVSTFGKVVLLECLKSNENIQVRLSDKEEQERVFVAMDELKLYLEQSGNHAIQN
eukprot:8750114-Ditylum_brightwellii.AAC.1